MIALFVTVKRASAYVSLARMCEPLSRCSIRLGYSRARCALLACGALVHPTLEEALEVYAQKLNPREREARAR